MVSTTHHGRSSRMNLSGIIPPNKIKDFIALTKSSSVALQCAQFCHIGWVERKVAIIWPPGPMISQHHPSYPSAKQLDPWF